MIATLVRRSHANVAASASLIALIGLCVAWELWLAPLRPGGSWLVVKALPLLLPLFGVLRGSLPAHQWACLLVLMYLLEGAVRGWTDAGTARWLGGAEVALSAIFYASAAIFAKTFPKRPRSR